MKIESLIAGLFPIQLPPCFSTTSYQNFVTNNLQWINNNKEDFQKNICKLETYTYPKSSFYRRTTHIANPISYLYLSLALTENWDLINAHFNKSDFSISSIMEPNESSKRLKRAPASEFDQAKITLSSGYPFALISDISNFYQSIYTHSIPWALYTKEVAKNNRRHYSPPGNLIDTLVRNGQDSQTLGIPIGPDTFEIISEIIGTAIDSKLKESISGQWTGFRYVDDFYCFFNTYEEAECALASLIKILSEFELQINHIKTKIVSTKAIINDSWPLHIKQMATKFKVKHFSPWNPVGEDKLDKIQNLYIHNFFEELFKLDEKYKNEGIVVYGLKQLSRYRIRKNNWTVLESYLFKCGYSFPRSIQLVARFIITYNQYFSIDKEATKRFCENIIRKHSNNNHHYEVAWALWLAMVLKLDISPELKQGILDMSSSVCKLLLLKVYKNNITNDDKNYFAQFLQKEELCGSNWLIAYEYERILMPLEERSDFIKQSIFFDKLASEGISFYHNDTELKPFWKIKEADNKNDAFESVPLSIDSLEDSNFDFYDSDDDIYFDIYLDEGDDDDESNGILEDNSNSIIPTPVQAMSLGLSHSKPPSTFINPRRAIRQSALSPNLPPQSETSQNVHIETADKNPKE